MYSAVFGLPRPASVRPQNFFMTAALYTANISLHMRVKIQM